MFATYEDGPIETKHGRSFYELNISGKACYI
jgi:hypothetical protein